MSEIEDKVNAGALTKVASLSVGETDTAWLVRHYTGLGSIFKHFDFYVIRRQKFLGRFVADMNDWIPNPDHKQPASPDEVIEFKKIMIMMSGLADKVWK